MQGIQECVPKQRLGTIKKKKPLEVYQRLSTLNVGEVGMSTITFGELRYGAEKSQHREIALQKLVQLEQYIPVVMPTKETVKYYGIIRCFLEKQGQPIGNNDLWIAAHALSLNWALPSLIWIWLILFVLPVV